LIGINSAGEKDLNLGCPFSRVAWISSKQTLEEKKTPNVELRPKKRAENKKYKLV
jgi:hypothetical protein